MNTKNLAPGIAIVMVLMLATAAALLATPVLANPPEDKYVASLYDNGDRYGQAIYNTNLEDDVCYELEVEVEECMALASTEVDTTIEYNVYLEESLVCTIDVDEFGNGKVTCCVDDIGTANTVTVGDEDELTSGEWRLWQQGSGKK